MSLSTNMYPSSQFSHNKFSHLPDIDHNNPDCFETPDPIPTSDASYLSSSPVIYPSSHHDDDLSSIHHQSLSPSTAMSYFSNSGLLPATDIDSSVSTHSHSFRTYNRATYDNLLRQRIAMESPLQRLQRLRLEANELQQQLLHSHATTINSTTITTTTITATTSMTQSNDSINYADALVQLSSLTKDLDNLLHLTDTTTTTSPSSSSSSFTTTQPVSVPTTTLMNHIRACQSLPTTSSSLNSDLPTNASKSFTYQSIPFPSSNNYKNIEQDNKITYQVYYQPDIPPTPTSSTHGQLMDIETRINTLETLIGHVIEPDLVPNESLINMLTRIDRHLIYLANPRHINTLSRQLVSLNELIANLLRRSLPLPSSNLLTTSTTSPTSTTTTNNTRTSSTSTSFSTFSELNHSHSTSTAAPSSSSSLTTTMDRDTKSRIDSLYTLVTKIDPLVPIIPRVLNRIQSLHSLHTDANHILNTVNQLSHHIDRNDLIVRDLHTMVSRLEQVIADNTQVIATNITNLDNRILSLINRVERLI